MSNFCYPRARRDPAIDEDYHGYKVADPYRCLENPDSEETQAFVDAQNRVTIPFLEKCAFREKLSERLTEMWDYPKYGCPEKHGSNYFYSYNTGLQNQSILYKKPTLDSTPVEFFDPNKLSADGTIAISDSAYSEDGRYFAYGLSKSGSDWITIKIRDVETMQDLPDVLENAKFSCISWTHDSQGLFYNQYPVDGDKSDGTETTSNYNQKLYYHRLGTPQSKDVICAQWPDDPEWITGAEVSHCGRYIVITISKDCDPVNQLYFYDLHQSHGSIDGILPVVKVVENFDANYEYVTNEESVFTFRTNLNAPYYRLVNIDFNNFEMANWTTLVEQHEHDVLEWASCVHQNLLVLCYLHDVKNVLHIHDLASGKHLTTLPLDIGSIDSFSGHKKHSEIFYNFVSFLTPGIIYRCDLTSNKMEPELYHETKLKGLDRSNFETKQVFYPAKDNPDTKIPMFIVHKKGLQLDGSNPLLVYGYGGFNISIVPCFSVSRVVFMNHLNGVLAVPNIRGGGEYGEIWHRAAMLANKQKVFDDFQAAVEYLIGHKYSNPKSVVINGASNGGLLVAACANQRPDLFGCVIAQVGVMDMLRFHKFTIGHAWVSEFGCSDKEKEYQWVIKYSPLHNIPKEPGVEYPATLLLTADHDDRVVPLHSLKFIATLQHTFQGCEKQSLPLMIKVDTKAGHGFGKPTTKKIEELTDIYSFISVNLNLQWKD